MPLNSPSLHCFPLASCSSPWRESPGQNRKLQNFLKKERTCSKARSLLPRPFGLRSWYCGSPYPTSFQGTTADQICFGTHVTHCPGAAPAPAPVSPVHSAVPVMGPTCNLGRGPHPGQWSWDWSCSTGHLRQQSKYRGRWWQPVNP